MEAGARISEAVLDAIPEIVCTYDLAGRRLTYVNGRVSSLGYTPGQLLGLDGARLAQLLNRNDLRRIAAAWRPARVRMAAEIACRVRNASGEWQSLEGCALDFKPAAGARAQVLVIVREATDRGRLEAEVRRTQSEVRRNREAIHELAADLLGAQEEERKRISRELHDELAQQLAMLEVGLDALGDRLPHSMGQLRGELRLLKSRAGELSEAVRRLAHRLHPAVLEQLGLVPALASHCSELSAQNGLRVRFCRRKIAGDIPPDTALCLYRIAQEALRNAVRHSGATHATVTLSRSKTGLILTISDSGSGFNPDSRKGSGLGLLGMRERVRLIGGTLAVTSAHGSGTTVQARVPLRGRRR